ncbi:MAG TPA: ADP-ribosylglycohydrolase [Gammaproteobacteria bacterium]|nr:ADP-ribosylglycohydrolase [Gammaproteobacteria bacterium]
MSTGNVSDTPRGCLLGGAVGGALGAPIEFMRWDEIRKEYGPSGLQSMVSAYGRLGAITDDAQMTLFTAEAMIHARLRAAMRGMVSLRDVACYSYQRWMLTQDEAVAPDDLEPRSLLLDAPELRSRRGPGRTCLSALRAPKTSEGKARNDSKGCGGVMRAAPCGLFWLVDESAGSTPFEHGVISLQITHGHPTGALTAGALAHMVYAIGRGASLRESAAQALQLLASHPDHAETTQAIEGAIRLADIGARPGPLKIRELGEGWVAEEALAIGLYAALVATDLPEGLLLAVNHDGDSDSTGSIAGNLLGAVHGEQAIPQEWLTPLECCDLITLVADDLVTCMAPDMDPAAAAPPTADARRDYWRRWGFDLP